MNNDHPIQYKNPIKRFFLNDKLIFLLILINAFVLFLQGFPDTSYAGVLSWIDNGISFLFVLEMLVKIAHFGFANYIRVAWNRFDALLVLLSLPSMAMVFFPLENFVDLGFLMVCRIFRVFKFFRFVQFFPQVDHIFRSVQKALKASVMVLIGFFVVIFIVAIMTCFFFQGINEEVNAMFGNPFKAYYTIFQVFTVEGWNTVPAELCEKANFDETTSFFVKILFAGLFIMGGVFGLSIVNSLFVDAMISDEQIEEAADDIEEKTDKITEHLVQLQTQIAQLTSEVQALKNKDNRN